MAHGSSKETKPRTLSPTQAGTVPITTLSRRQRQRPIVSSPHRRSPHKPTPPRTIRRGSDVSLMWCTRRNPPPRLKAMPEASPDPRSCTLAESLALAGNTEKRAARAESTKTRLAQCERQGSCAENSGKKNNQTVL
ncbi:hypothetical protein HPB49_009736 [Dermacentor silvarum]|uniref:Uncharacterized protein n=1 Tax=Dermacentor silvarum TaxID=543639 RepID=A0ACB8DC73_DERSI|nr:hypothetical protein HPB49_009736 [Dermacentor silvarum]